MPVLTTTSALSLIETPLPPSTSLPIILSTLHTHTTLIYLNSLVTSCTSVTTDASSPHQVSAWLTKEADKVCKETLGAKAPKYYSITDKNPLWGRLSDIRYQAAMIDVTGQTENGLNVVVEAPGGTRIWQRWRVVGTEGDQANDDDGPWTLVEEPTVQCWSAFAGFVKRTLEKAHAENHRKLRKGFEKGEGRTFVSA